MNTNKIYKMMEYLVKKNNIFSFLIDVKQIKIC